MVDLVGIFGIHSESHPLRQYENAPACGAFFFFAANKSESGIVSSLETERTHVAKPNYQFEKRQRELEKKKKKAEKAQKKSSGANHAPDATDDGGNVSQASDAPSQPPSDAQPGN